MKKENIFSFMKFFSRNFKFLIFAIIVVVIIIVYFWLKKNKNKNDTGNKQQAIIDGLSVKGSGLSKSQALLYADQLEKAMQRHNNTGGYDGTDEKTITTILLTNYQNPKNLTHIYKSFGIRDKKTTLFTVQSLTLDEWFKDDLDEEEYDQVKKLWNHYNNDIKFA